MASGDRDAVLQPHQLGQQFAARNDGNQQAARFLHLRIGGIHGGTHHNRLGAGNVGGRVTFVNPRAERRQPFRGGAQLQVRPADLISQIQQHLGDAAHANAADSDEVQVLRLKKHFNLVLFRLSRAMSTGNRFFQHICRAARRIGMRKSPSPLSHAM